MIDWEPGDKLICIIQIDAVCGRIPPVTLGEIVTLRVVIPAGTPHPTLRVSPPPIDLVEVEEHIYPANHCVLCNQVFWGHPAMCFRKLFKPDPELALEEATQHLDTGAPVRRRVDA